MKYKVEWYLDIPGHEGIREIEVEAEDEDEATEIAYDTIVNNIIIGDVSLTKNKRKNNEK